MKDKKEKKRIESDMIIISILILLLIIGLITKPYKKKMKQEEVIQNISEHNWGKNGEDLLKCVHCKRTLKIGDLIEYKPDKTTNTVRIMDKETGMGINNETSEEQYQEFYQEEETYWKVFGVKDTDNNGTNETLLIKMATETELYLYGATGYNNGVHIMNEICEKLYSNSKYGKARSITIEDIENILEVKSNGGFYATRDTEGNLYIYEFEGKLKESPIWNSIIETNAYYAPDGTNTIEILGEYELNGHGYEIKEEKENGIIIENPGTNKSKYIKSNIVENIWKNQKGEMVEYLLATKGVIAEPNIVAFGLGSVSDKYVRTFCDMYYSTRRRRTNIRCIMSNCGIKK